MQPWFSNGFLFVPTPTRFIPAAEPRALNANVRAKAAQYPHYPCAIFCCNQKMDKKGLFTIPFQHRFVFILMVKHFFFFFFLK